jgi:hypothetical protein
MIAPFSNTKQEKRYNIQNSLDSVNFSARFISTPAKFYPVEVQLHFAAIYLFLLPQHSLLFHSRALQLR